MTVAFSLLDRPWIACAMPDGSTTELSLREVFEGSCAAVEIRGDSPTQDYAVLRVLLAIFWRAHRHEADVRPGRTFDVEEWFSAARASAVRGDADQAVLSYLDEHAPRFDLLDPAVPFMQVADLRTSKGIGPISRIVPEAEGSHFAMRAGSGIASIGLAEAARWVIHAQAYDYSGIKPGAEGDPRVKGGKGYPIGTGWTGSTGGTVVLGETLRETLVLNTTSACLRSGDRDAPVWEREPDGPGERVTAIPRGPADLATWQARRIRLDVQGDRAVGVLVTNGDRIPEAGKDIRDDPMTPYRFSANQTKKGQAPVYYARPYDTERMMWRSLEPLVALAGEQLRGEHPPLRPATLTSLAELEIPTLGSVGLRLISASYGPQASANATSVDARLELPLDVLSTSSRRMGRALLDSSAATQSAAVALGRFAGNLLVAAGGEYAFQVAPTESALAMLEAPFQSWLRDLRREDLDSQSRRWQAIALALIEEHALVLLRGAGPAALIGREEMVNDKPQLRSAGTAYRRLRSELRDALPLAPAHQTPISTASAH